MCVCACALVWVSVYMQIRSEILASQLKFVQVAGTLSWQLLLEVHRVMRQ